MNLRLLLIILATITVQGARPGNQQEKSINLNAKRQRGPGSCAYVKGGECRPRPMDPNVWPCPDPIGFICVGNPCPEALAEVCCCPGFDGPIFN